MHIEARFYETYEMCAVVDTVLANRFDHLIKLEGFHCDGQWTAWTQPYGQYSVFHRFIEFIVRNVHDEQAEAVDIAERKAVFVSFADIPAALDDLRPDRLPIEAAFDRYEIDYLSFGEFLSESGRLFQDADEDDIYEFMNEIRLSEAYEKLLDKTVKEVFHILFQNRSLLLMFNEFVSGVLSMVRLDDAEDLDSSMFTSNGTLKRVRAPAWAQRAVFFRDRGRCVLCDQDLSGLTNIANVENYDHIVPLSRFGLNDISNLQLLCERCNQRVKRDGEAVTSTRYQTWYRYG